MEQLRRLLHDKPKGELWTQACDKRIDMFRAACALGEHMAGTGVQRIEFRPASPSPGFDPNLPA